MNGLVLSLPQRDPQNILRATTTGGLGNDEIAARVGAGGTAKKARHEDRG
ncbi:MAG: hypothetical protein NTY05_15030 [Rhodocyclales bacterium]|nr:hypothetical protein [Rhodocyclales bacterium]